MSHQGYYTNPSNLENINDALLDVEADANRAEAAAANALTSEQNAANSVIAAETVASSTLGYANAAQASAADAANSATSALGNAAIAEGHADAAALSATNANNSAAQAALSAVDSANSATSAANSASAAAASAASINPANFLLKADNLSGLADVSQSRANLGLGTIATQNSNSVSITGGSVTGITDLAIADGGTGSSTASGARTNLGVYSTTEVDTLKASKSGDTFTGNVNVPSLNGGQLAGMRNKIINGKMEIAQRGTSFPAIASSSYSIDRWVHGNATSAVGTISQVPFAQAAGLQFQNALFYTVTTADSSIGASEGSTIIQRIEGYNVRDLVGVTFTLSFWVRSSKTGIHCVRFGNSGNDRVYVSEYTVNTANTWEFKSVTVSGGIPLSGGTWDFTNGTGLAVQFVLAAGSSLHTTAGSWQSNSAFATSNQVNCLDTVGNVFAITGVQLEVGSVATPFEHRPYGQELELCRRYYRSTAFRHTVSLYAAGAYDSITFPADTMRATPTMAWGLSENANATNVASGSPSQFVFTAIVAGTCVLAGVVTQSVEL